MSWEWSVWATPIVSVKRCTLHWRIVQIFIAILLTCVDAIPRVLDHAAHTSTLNDVIEHAEFFGWSFMAPRLRSWLLRLLLLFLLIPKEYLMILLLMRFPRLMILDLWRISLLVNFLVFNCSDRRWSNYLYRHILFLLYLTLRSQIRSSLLCRLDCLDLAALVPCCQIRINLLKKLGKFLIEPFTCCFLLLRILRVVRFSLLCWNSLSWGSGTRSFNCVYILDLIYNMSGDEVLNVVVRFIGIVRGLDVKYRGGWLKVVIFMNHHRWLLAGLCCFQYWVGIWSLPIENTFNSILATRLTEFP